MFLLLFTEVVSKRFPRFKSDSPLKRAGDYLLGPKHGSSPVKCIEQYLARKDGTDEFVVIKVRNASLYI